jgi:spore germination protein GerM
VIDRRGAPRRLAGRVRLVALLVAVCGIVVVACGIPVDSSPRTISRGALPKALTGSTTSQPPGTGTVVTEEIFLVRSNGNAEVLSPVVLDGIPLKSSNIAQAQDLLTRLIEQQSSPPSGNNLTNAIPSTVRVLGARLDDDVLELDVSNLDTVESTQQRLAFAEMVFTATGVIGIDSVRFSIDGLPAQVPIDNSTSTAGAAITRADYRQLTSGN